MNLVPNPVRLPRLEPPLTYGRDERSAFTRGEHERPLRLLVDDAALGPAPALDAVMALTRHELLEVTTTSPAGPASLSINRTVGSDDQMLVTTTQSDGSSSLSGIWPASQWQRFARDHTRARGGDAEAIESRYLLGGAAHGRVDGLVLGGPIDGNLARRSNPLDVAQAAALVGLFLRSRGAEEVLLWDRGRETADIGTQRFIVTRCLLDAGWRWWSACVAASKSPGHEATMRIAQGVQIRFERSLRARDEVMIECLGEAGGRAIERDVLYHLDAMLLWLGGAFDSVAQVADRVYSLSSSPHVIGWRRSGWRNTVATAAPHLHRLTEPGTPARAVIDLVAVLRNTIHGEPVTGVTYSGAGKDQVGLIQLPAVAEAEALSASGVLGGRELWGFVREGSGPVAGLWDPYFVAQMVPPFAAAALNALMDATEVERLPGVDTATLRSGRPTDGFFEPTLVERLLALNGIRA